MSARSLLNRSASTEPADVTPSASRLTSSLRDIGYEFNTAVADIVDNSVSAGACRVDIELVADGERSYVLIADDGAGMTNSQLCEALRFGSRRTYSAEDLGRYGLGLKTASLSQCRRLTALSRRAPERVRLAMRTLDLDHIEHTDRWELTAVPIDSFAFRALEWLEDSPGTVVLWEKLDRVLPGGGESKGGTRRRLNTLARRTAEHLGMVFHRFLEGSVGDRDRLTITVNGEKVAPWNPFAPGEEHTVALPPRRFEVVVGGLRGEVTMTPFVLPPRSRFSSQDQFEYLGGPAKWNRQQGFYIYRANRLIQSGGWAGLRAIDEHTKLARVALDFSPALDDLFRINVAKMRATIPPEVRTLLEEEVASVCSRAQAVYRHGARTESPPPAPPAEEPRVGERTAGAPAIGAALMAASFVTGETEALERIISYLREQDPGVLNALGWD